MCILLEVQEVQKLVRREDVISTSLFHRSCGKECRAPKWQTFSPILWLETKLPRQIEANDLFNCNRSFVPVGNHFIGTAEHGTRAGAIGLTDEPFALHHVENCRGATIADAQASLQNRR